MSRATRIGLTLLALLLLVDLILIGFHIIHVHTPYLETRYFRIDREAGIAEHFQYLKAMGIAAAFLAVAMARSERTFAIWAGVFAYLMLDDGGEIHERLGLLIAEAFHYPGLFGLRPRDVGELTVAVLLGMSLVTAVGLGYVRGSPVFRRATRTTIVLLGGLAFFGVVVDAVHIVWTFPRFDPLLILEDGGEMMVMSGIVTYAWTLVRANVRLVCPEQVDVKRRPDVLHNVNGSSTMRRTKPPHELGGRGD